MKKLVAIILSLLTFALLGLIFLILHFKLMSKEFAFEIAKNLMQLITVIIIGQIIHLFVNEYNKRKQEEKSLNDYRSSLLNKINNLNIEALKFIHTIRSNAIIYEKKRYTKLSNKD